jgi:hypothetical protein
VSDKQLRELHIKLNLPKEKTTTATTAASPTPAAN